MPGTVRDIPGVRPGARVYVFSAGSDDAVQTRIEDLDANWIAVGMPDKQPELSRMRIGVLVDLEVPQPGGDVFLQGTIADHRFDGIQLAVIRVEHVGADEGASGKEQRRHFRMSVSLPVKRFVYRGRDGGWEEGCAVLRDLGGGGASVIMDVDLEPGTEVQLSFPMPLEALECSVAGTVVSSRVLASGRHPEYRASLSFQDLPEMERNWVIRQLYRYQWSARNR